jgi:hypothetical protein
LETMVCARPALRVLEVDGIAGVRGDDEQVELAREA